MSDPEFEEPATAPPRDDPGPGWAPPVLWLLAAAVAVGTPFLRVYTLHAGGALGTQTVGVDGWGRYVGTSSESHLARFGIVFSVAAGLLLIAVVLAVLDRLDSGRRDLPGDADGSRDVTDGDMTDDDDLDADDLDADDEVEDAALQLAVLDELDRERAANRRRTRRAASAGLGTVAAAVLACLTSVLYLLTSAASDSAGANARLSGVPGAEFSVSVGAGVWLSVIGTLLAAAGTVLFVVGRAAPADPG